MRTNRYGRKFLTILAALTLAAGAAAAYAEAPGEPALTEMQLELGGSNIVYPALTGMTDETLQQDINKRMQEDLNVDGYLERMTILLAEENQNIQVTWEGTLFGDVLSRGRRAAELARHPPLDVEQYRPAERGRNHLRGSVYRLGNRAGGAGGIPGFQRIAGTERAPEQQ